MNITKLVKKYEEHQEKKLNSIELCACVMEANLIAAVKAETEKEKAKYLDLVLGDVRYIKDELAKNDFNVSAEMDKLG